MYGTICTSTASYKSSATLICLQAMCIVLVNLLNKIMNKKFNRRKKKRTDGKCHQPPLNNYNTKLNNFCCLK